MKKMIRLCAAAVALVSIISTAFAIPADCATFVAQTAYGAKNTGTMLSMDIGNETPKKVNIGSEIVSIQSIYYCNHYEHCHNTYYCGCNQYTATNTSSSSCELPYSKFSTACPYARTVLTNVANSLGYIPGDAFGLEIGKFTCYSGYTPCTTLSIPMNYEMPARVRAGCVPGMLALLPNGAVMLLNGAEFDQTYSSQWYTDGSRMYYLHTMYPDAVYMLVHIPQ